MSIEVTVSDARFSILEPVVAPARTELLWLTDSAEDLRAYLADVPQSDYLAIDFETNSTDFTGPDFKVVTIGVSSSIGSLAVDTRDWDEKVLKEELFFLSRFNLVAHNVPFDGGVFNRYVPFRDTNWKYCTFGLYKQLGSEGFPGQKHSLKYAQKALLLWEDTNEKEVDEWLVREGFITNTARLSTLDTPEKRLEAYESRDKNGNRKLKPDKSKLGLVPHEYLGYYCALDADSTWLLLTKVLLPALAKVPPVTREFHQGPFLNSVAIATDWAFQGVPVDRERLLGNLQEINKKQEELTTEFFSEPEIAKRVAYYQEEKLAEETGKEPEKFLKKKLGKEPDRHTKSGEVSKNWLRWKEKEQEEPVTSKNWLRWKEKKEELENTRLFNLNSGDQLRWLFYAGKEDGLPWEAIVKYEDTREHESADRVGRIRIEGKAFDLNRTDGGALPVDKSLLELIGELGRPLLELSRLSKLASTYYSRAIEKSERDNRIIPNIIIPGTNTGRWAGTGGLNWQNLPNDEDFLSCFIADEGYSMVAADFSSLEPHVLAEGSRDPTLLQLYGPNAKANDVYLFLGTRIGDYKEKLLAVGYDAENPTPEGIKAAKSAFSKERGIWKVVHLSAGYKAGPESIYMNLAKKEVDITFEEVVELHRTYWSDSLFSGIKSFDEQLVREWKENGGFFLGAIGNPVTVCEGQLRDVVNQFCQRGGHDELTIFISQLDLNLREEGIDFKWIIPDLHDETIYQVRTDQLDRALEVHAKTVDWLNEYLGGVTKLKMDPKVIKSLAERKD